jgi:cytochrome c553
MSKFIAGLIAVFGISFANAASIEAGQAKAAVCAACHGPDGNSAVATFPSIAGQGINYTVKQLKDFKSGERKDPVMGAQVLALSDEDMADLALFFSAQNVKGGEAAADLVERGEALYRGGDAAKGISACIACHGPRGKGNNSAKYPAIAGQHAVYAESQLNKFKDGSRANDLNSMMRDIAAKMSSDDIKAVASYIQGLR